MLCSQPLAFQRTPSFHSWFIPPICQTQGLSSFAVQRLHEFQPEQVGGLFHCDVLRCVFFWLPCRASTTQLTNIASRPQSPGGFIGVGIFICALQIWWAFWGCWAFCKVRNGHPQSGGEYWYQHDISFTAWSMIPYEIRSVSPTVVSTTSVCLGSDEYSGWDLNLIFENATHYHSEKRDFGEITQWWLRRKDIDNSRQIAFPAGFGKVVEKAVWWNETVKDIWLKMEKRSWRFSSLEHGCSDGVQYYSPMAS